MRTTPQQYEFLGMPAVVASEPMHQLIELVKRIGMSSAAVLITGESGTGKEIIARALHHYSLRGANAWVDVNCAAFPEHLIESELFGYEKGAFSGAATTKRGLFEVADGGTLFLDEIGELEGRTQVKLLRVLDGVSYYRLGGTKKVSVNVRVIAATNRDLEAEVAAGKFRPDLYHRLTEIEIDVPPLRERPGDAVALARFFLDLQNPNLRLASDAQELLRTYSWPGNVRELRNAVTKAVLMASGPEIHAADLRLEAAPAAAAELNLDTIERRMIAQALSATAGHQQRAAELLGISQRTLNRKLKRYRSEELVAQPVAI